MRGTSDGSGKPVKTGIAAGAAVVAALGLGVTGCATTTALPQATCGTAITHQLDAVTQVLSADKGALNCFDAAMRHCQAASLAMTEMGVDAGTHYVFTVKPGGTGCPVDELSQGYGGPSWEGGITTTPCRLAQATGAGVMLSCAGADVLIPDTVTRLGAPL